MLNGPKGRARPEGPWAYMSRATGRPIRALNGPALMGHGPNGPAGTLIIINNYNYCNNNNNIIVIISAYISRLRSGPGPS